MEEIQLSLTQYEKEFEKEIKQLTIFLNIAGEAILYEVKIENFYESKSKVCLNFNMHMEKEYQTFLGNCLEFKDEPSNSYKNSILVADTLRTSFCENSDKSQFIFNQIKQISQQSKIEFNEMKFGEAVKPALEELQTLKREFKAVKREFIKLKGEKETYSFNTNLSNDQEVKVKYEAILEEIKTKTPKMEEFHRQEEQKMGKLQELILKELENGVCGLLKMYSRIQKILQTVYEEEIKSLEKEVQLFSKTEIAWNETEYLENDSIEVKYMENKEESVIIEFDKMVLPQYSSTISQINSSNDPEESSKKLDLLCSELIKSTSDLQRYSNHFSNTIQIKKVLFSKLKNLIIDLIKNCEVFLKEDELNNCSDIGSSAFIGPQLSKIWKNFKENSEYKIKAEEEKQKFVDLINFLTGIKKKLECETSAYINKWSDILNELYNHKSNISRLSGTKERVKNKFKTNQSPNPSQTSPTELARPAGISKGQYIDELRNINSKILNSCEKYNEMVEKAYMFMKNNNPEMKAKEYQFLILFKSEVTSLFQFKISILNERISTMKTKLKEINSFIILKEIKALWSKHYLDYGINPSFVDKAINDACKRISTKNLEDTAAHSAVKPAGLNKFEIPSLEEIKKKSKEDQKKLKETRQPEKMKESSNSITIVNNIMEPEKNDKNQQNLENNRIFSKRYNSDQDIEMRDKKKRSALKKSEDDKNPDKLKKSYNPLRRYLHRDQAQVKDEGTIISDTLYGRLKQQYEQNQDNIMSIVKKHSSGKLLSIKKMKAREKFLTGSNRNINTNNIQQPDSDASKLRRKALSSNKTMPEETVNLKESEVVLSQNLCKFLGEKNKTIIGKLYITNWKITFISINSSFSASEIQKYNDDHKSSLDLKKEEEVNITLEYKNMSHITLTYPTRESGLGPNCLTITTNRGIELKIIALLEEKYCYFMIKYILICFNCTTLHNQAYLKLFKKLAEHREVVLNFVIYFLSAISKSSIFKGFLQRDQKVLQVSKPSLQTYKSFLQDVMDAPPAVIDIMTLTSEDKVQQLVESLIELDDFTATRAKEFEDTNLFHSQGFFKNVIEKDLYISSSPLSILYLSLFDPNYFVEEFNKGKWFYLSIFELTGAKEIKLNFLSGEDKGDIPKFYKSLEEVSNIFSVNSLVNNDIHSNFKSLMDNFVNSNRQVKYSLNYIETIKGTICTMEAHIIVNFVSPTLLVVELIKRGKGYAKIDCYERIVQYRFSNTIQFDEYNRRLHFRTEVACLFKVHFLMDSFFFSIIEKENFKTEENEWKNIMVPKMSAVLESRDCIMASSLLEHDSYTIKFLELELVEFGKFVKYLEEEISIINPSNNIITSKLVIKSDYNQNLSFQKTSEFALIDRPNYNETQKFGIPCNKNFAAKPQGNFNFNSDLESDLDKQDLQRKNRNLTSNNNPKVQQVTQFSIMEQDDKFTSKKNLEKHSFSFFKHSGSPLNEVVFQSIGKNINICSGSSQSVPYPFENVKATQSSPNTTTTTNLNKKSAVKFTDESNSRKEREKVKPNNGEDCIFNSCIVDKISIELSQSWDEISEFLAVFKNKYYDAFPYFIVAFLILLYSLYCFVLNILDKLGLSKLGSFIFLLFAIQVYRRSIQK